MMRGEKLTPIDPPRGEGVGGANAPTKSRPFEKWLSSVLNSIRNEQKFFEYIKFLRERDEFRFRALAGHMYKIMDIQHSTYCNYSCFTLSDVKKALSYLSLYGYLPEKFIKTFGNVSYRHFIDELNRAISLKMWSLSWR